MEVEITWDRHLLNKLQIAYDKAVEEDKEVFTFKGEQFVTSYAKYLIEHLENNL